MHKSLRKLAEAITATTMVLELLEELHQKYIVLKMEVIGLYEKWDAQARDLKFQIEDVTKSNTVDAYVEGYQDAIKSRLHKHYNDMGL